MPSARFIRVRGIVQGVGFRPFVFRLARARSLAGWVLNGPRGVEIHVEGGEAELGEFVREIETQAPPAADVASIEVMRAEAQGLREFTIHESSQAARPTARISPDLPVCEACLKEMYSTGQPRSGYSYVNCTNCGPRYSVIQSLPYDRCNTSMSPWPMDAYCAAQYQDPSDRRFHAQPIACHHCGPHYYFSRGSEVIKEEGAAIAAAAKLLREGSIIAVKGIGGYHLACDAWNTRAVRGLRKRKYRKEKPFALMARNLAAAEKLARLSAEAELLLQSAGRPIVLAPARLELDDVAPDSDEVGVMLPYTPLQHLLFANGAPEVLVMTSANRSSEPIAYRDEEAIETLHGIADGFLIGERPIVRRVDDSVVRQSPFGPVILRRGRGYAPSAVANLPAERPILAAGADLKNSVTLVVEGQAFVSQHIGDLDHYECLRAFEETIRDLVSMYEVDWRNLTVAHDLHPEYFSTAAVSRLSRSNTVAVQHHRAHIAGVLAERGEFGKQVLGVAFDGTGYGDDGAIWGGEFFVGSISSGFERVAHLRPAMLPGGDAAARFPVQAAAGFLTAIEDLPDFGVSPFCFPSRFAHSVALVRKGFRSFPTTSMGRLFDTAAAMLGFTRESTFEGQAAMWLEHLARGANTEAQYPFPFDGSQLDFRPLLAAVLKDRLSGRPPAPIARSFQRAIAQGLCDAAMALCAARKLDTVVLSGGVFQNNLLLDDIREILSGEPLDVWINHVVPPNDGGISLGQAAMAAMASK
ncbi:MAG: carbamoyltransferase HypF [Bryobacterales bacterium]|nr:carbamoyltransferase HypF [Bryobacterales bacterium]